MNLQRAWVLVGLVAFGSVGCSSGAQIPADARAALEKADEWELYSLDPTRQTDPPKDAFHGWKVLGKTTVKDADTRKKLLAALEKGAKDNDGIAAACFNPRHGVRVKAEGKTIDLVICFECFSASVYAGDERTASFLTTASPQPALDKVLTDAKVPLPGKDR
jgi:hypothetical protein